MKKKLAIGIMGLFLLTTIYPLSAVGSILKNDIDEGNFVSTNDDWHLSIVIKNVYMEDCIDETLTQTDNYADWYFNIWVSGGEDDDGDDYWHHVCPPDKWKLEQYNKQHQWAIGNQEEIQIKIEK